MKHILGPALAILTLGLVSQMAYPAQRLCPAPWRSHSANADDCTLSSVTLKTWSGWTGSTWNVSANIRSGYLAENPSVPFRGNVIYYEGLGDSMLNHQPLFNKLTAAGYRVIAFDYMGQGGSSGSMNDTRIWEIGVLGEKIWKLHARDLSHFPKWNIIGWSTGGLAAYVQARIKSDVSNVVLIAPGIVPKKLVGKQNILGLKFNQITLPTLTTVEYADGAINPHIDPIKPESPLEVLDFAWDLIITAMGSRGTPASARINGFVLLSGKDDTYVDAKKTAKVLRQDAPLFTVRKYPNTLHEIDNEAEPNQSQAHQDILDFLNKVN